jgi:WD40 repeat protein
LYRDLPGHTTTVNSATFSADSKQIVTAGKDGHVRLFNAESGALVREFPSEGGEAMVAVLSPDARLVAAGHADGGVRVWNTADGTVRRRITPDGSPVYGVAFSRDGTSLATATLNGNVRLWDTPTGTRTGEFKSAGPVVSVEFSADGRFIVAAGGRTVLIRDVSTGQVVMSATPASNTRGAAFRPDGRAIVTADVDHTARIFACDLCVSGPTLKALAGDRLKRNFTDEERALYLGTDSASRSWIRSVTRSVRWRFP